VKSIICGKSGLLCHECCTSTSRELVVDWRAGSAVRKPHSGKEHGQPVDGAVSMGFETVVV
jgi:hypothetical protein